MQPLKREFNIFVHKDLKKSYICFFSFHSRFVKNFNAVFKFKPQFVCVQEMVNYFKNYDIHIITIK